MVSESIRKSFPETYWIVSEISDVRINASGHCYLEFVEKDSQSGTLIARAKGNIWNNIFKMLKPYFEQTTRQSFVSGIKILVKVSVDFHELYGYSLTVCDIDPVYTLGDMKRHRQQILQQLEEEGVVDLNKELEFPLFPQRIAIISSETAAGWEDFFNQLQNNPYGFVFYTKLFPAIMQGKETEESIIQALNHIYKNRDKFDLVVIIRGGGSSSDLQYFDSYMLAANCAQFPLPIIAGIGHERDETVLDYVVNRRVKTPTAAAALLIEAMQEIHLNTIQMQEEIISICEEKIKQNVQNLQKIIYGIHANASNLIVNQKARLDLYDTSLKNIVNKYIFQHKHQIEAIEQFIHLSSPSHILSKGYSITTKNGQVIKSSQLLRKGDKIQTIFYEGKSESIVEKTE